MSVNAQTLNQYVGTDKLGNQTTIVADSMTVACQVYNEQESDDPVMMQCTKQNIKCVLPEVFVSFTTVVTDSANTGGAEASCTATPKAYSLLAGTEQIFTATPGEGWVFEKWQIDGVDVTGAEGTKPVALLKIPTSASPITIQAVFKTNI